MPDFKNAFKDGRIVFATPAKDVVRWAMEASGTRVGVAPAWSPLWFIGDAGGWYEGARLMVSNRDSAALDAYDIELWTQEPETGGGILVASVSVASTLATFGSSVAPSLPRDIVEVGARSRGWGVRARMTAGAPRQFAAMLTLFCRMPSSGLLWKGEGVS